MAKQGQLERSGSTGARRLDELGQAAQKVVQDGLPPVERWNPPYCGDLDLRIARDGTWLYLGTPIARPELVRLFARVLKKEGERYFLVTPVEKVGIAVDDAPFLAVEMARTIERGEPQLTFLTNAGDVIACNAEHPLRFADALHGGLTPYLHVRSDLWAKVSRSLYYELVDLGEVRAVDGEEIFGVASGGSFFAIADAAQTKDSTV